MEVLCRRIDLKSIAAVFVGHLPDDRVLRIVGR